MRICFSGFGQPVFLEAGLPSVLEVHSRKLFSRICSSLQSGEGVYALEPYSLWDDEGVELKPNKQFLFVADLFNLPWDDRLMAGALAARMEELLREDESVRRKAEEAFGLLSSQLAQLALQLDSSYSFAVDWELKRYLKTFGFGVDIAPDETLLDKLIKFLMLAKDVSLGQAIVFVNLKLFLADIELEVFYEQVFFSNLIVLLIENARDEVYRPKEKKFIIDQDLLEYWPSNKSEVSVPSQ